MPAEVFADEVVNAHTLWCEDGKPGAFRKYLKERNPELAETVQCLPTVFAALPRRVRRDFGAVEPRPPRRLALDRVRPYMTRILDKFLAGGEPEPSLEAFVGRLRCNCQDEGDLEKFLSGN